MKLNVSLYIPVYNGETTIKSVLESVFNLDPGPAEIIVINDGSTDKTIDILKIYENRIILVNNPKNMGLAYCRNIGMYNAKNENVAAIDADVEVSKEWLKDLFDIKNKFNSAISGAKLIEKYKDTNIYNLWRHFYATQNSFGDSDIENIKRPLAGGNTLLSKSAWEKAGRYDIRYKTNGEDSSLCYKLLSSNYKISYSAKAKCYHLRNDTLQSLVDSSRRGYIFGAGLKEPTIMRFFQRTIRHFKGFLNNSINDLKNLRFQLIYVGFRIFLNHLIKEFIALIKKKADYV